jgi:hypothetical protein
MQLATRSGRGVRLPPLSRPGRVLRIGLIDAPGNAARLRLQKRRDLPASIDR